MRGADVFVIQPTCTPVDHNLMELLLMIDAAEAGLGGAHHRSVTLLWVRAAGPEGQAAGADFGQTGGRRCWKRAGADRVLALDLHAAQIQGFFDIPVDHLFSAPVMIEYFKPLEHAGSDGGFAGCRRRGAGAGVRQAVERAAGDYR